MNELPQIPLHEEQLIQLARLNLEPLAVSHAKEMHPVLSDVRLHKFTGGDPPASEASLAQTYSIRVKQLSPDGKQLWLNWAVREQYSGSAIGYVQATVELEQTLIAWVIGVDWQSQGYASEAARGLVAWLTEFDFSRVRAEIHPDHHASKGVAKQAGLAFSGQFFEGEEVWVPA
jgi:RimJ/RimL family protein N-acetyltransferase